MHKKLFMFLVAFGIAILLFVKSAYSFFDNKYEKYNNSNVALLSADLENNLYISCSGTFISRNQIITAAHCVEEDKKNNFGLVRVINYETYLKEKTLENFVNYKFFLIKHFDAKRDLAILEIYKGEKPYKNVYFLEISNRKKLKLGEQVFSVANPSYLPWSFVFGKVANTNRIMTIEIDKKEETFLTTQINMFLYPGSSGSSIIDKYGNIVGIASTKYRYSTVIGFYVHINEIQNFLKEYNHASQKKNRNRIKTPRSRD